MGGGNVRCQLTFRLRAQYGRIGPDRSLFSSLGDNGKRPRRNPLRRSVETTPSFPWGGTEGNNGPNSHECGEKSRRKDIVLSATRDHLVCSTIISAKP